MTYVFKFQNLYIPEDEEYDSSLFDIRIEPVEDIEEFENGRTEAGSEYQTGYYQTAQCYIDEEEERAKELAERLSFIYSFFQNRDVRWDTYYPEDSPDEIRRLNTYQYPHDNSNHVLIKAVHESGSFYSRNIGPVVDIALETMEETDERHRADMKRNIGLFLESEGSQFMILKFLFLWIILEANADRYYNRYMKSQREFLFEKEEKERVRETVLEEFAEEFTEDQLERLEYSLGQDYIYEPSSYVKIKKYVESRDLGFDMDEIETIVKEGRDIRNQVVHSIEEAGLKENSNIFVDLRKVVMYSIIRELGIEPEVHQRLITPNIFGPDSEYD